MPAHDVGSVQPFSPNGQGPSTSGGGASVQPFWRSHHGGGELPYVVEPMRLDDLDQVLEIEKVAFSAPWSARSYQYEITQNEHSTLIVVRPTPRSRNRSPKWLSWLSRAGRGPVLGYAGSWLLVDEAHIATIAVHPDWRGQGLGELLLLTLLEKAGEQGAQQATLEVRVQNQIAQRLYHKLGFKVAGIRKGYYIDSKEDALIMTTTLFDIPEFQANLDQCRAKLNARLRDQKAPGAQLDLMQRTS